MNREWWLKVALGVAVGFGVWKLFLEHRWGGSALAGPIRLNPRKKTKRRGYKMPVSKTPRSKATSRCVFGKGPTCRFPVGDVYHERKALQYVQAGRCAPGDCEAVLAYLAKRARDPEVRQRAKKERGAILQSAYRAKRKRRKTRARKAA
jgi:hypothetical protein